MNAGSLKGTTMKGKRPFARQGLATLRVFWMLGILVLSTSPAKAQLLYVLDEAPSGNIRNGESAVRVIRVRPTAPGKFSNTATVTGNETDPNPRNNTATTVTTAR